MHKCRNLAARIVAVAVFFVLIFPSVEWQTPTAAEKMDPQEARCLALTLYWEARGAGRKVMTAVAWVVLNRRNSTGFPNTICGVVRQGGETPPCQFSYWCDGEPEVPNNETAWKLARQIADRMLNNPPSDPTHGALYFHSHMSAPPWAREHKRMAQLGEYIFYR